MAELAAHIFPATFPALALAHFLALLSPGPDFFLVVGHAARSRLQGTIGICLGIAIGNALYIALAVAGWSVLKEVPLLFTCMALAGAVYLAWLGAMLLRSSRNGAASMTSGLDPVKPGRQFAKGFASATLNPKNAIFYLTLMTVLIGPEATLLQQTATGIWMIFIVFAWDVGLAAIIGHPRVQKTIFAKIPLVEAVAGIALIALSLGFFYESMH